MVVKIVGLGKGSRLLRQSSPTLRGGCVLGRLAGGASSVAVTGALAYDCKVATGVASAVGVAVVAAEARGLGGSWLKLASFTMAM